MEIGSKNRFLDNSLQVNAAIYYYNYQGFQTTYVRDTANPLDPAGLNNTIQTTVPAHNIGAELEILYQITPQDRVGLNADYVRSSWYDKPADFALAQRETKRALRPYSISANYEHVFDLPNGSTLSARIDGRYEAAHLTQDLHTDLVALGYSNYVHVDSRAFGNLSATWASGDGRYVISSYVRNVTNTKYITHIVGGDTTALYVNWTDPRTFGVVLSAKF